MTTEERLVERAQQHAMAVSHTEPLPHTAPSVTFAIFEAHCRPAAEALTARLSSAISCPQEYHFWWETAWRFLVLRLGIAL